MILDQQFIFKAFDAEKNGEQFPIDFDDVWKELGYSRKNDAKNAMVANLIEHVDYLIDNGTKRNLTTTMFMSVQEKAAFARREVIKLSCDGYDHFCMSAQTPEGRQKRIEFIGYKKAYIAQLERYFTQNVPINPMIDPSRFDFTFDAALQVTGHQNRRDTLERLLGYLEIDTDYRWDGAKLYLSNPIYYSFIAASRTTKGIDTSQIGDTVVLDWNQYCRVNKALKTPRNNLFANKRAEEKQLNKPEQQTLF